MGSSAFRPAALAATLLLVLGGAGTAAASTYLFHMTGQIVGGTPGPQAGINIGDTYTMDARINGSHISGGVAGGYGLTDPGDFWSLTGSGLSWPAVTEEFDGFPVIYGDGLSIDGGFAYVAAPLIYFSGGHITGASGSMVPVLSATVPLLYLTGATFRIAPGEFLYGNTADLGSWDGVWDLQDSTVERISAIPEPAAWIAMLLGLFAAGGMLRSARFRRPVRAASLP